MGGVLESATALPRVSYSSNDPFEQEQRFLLTRAQVTRFFATIGPRATTETYDRTRPIAFTRTTYLDTDDFVYYRSCEGPVSRRLRVREYAMAASLDDAPVLSNVAYIELKQNAGNARSKVRLSAAPALLRRLIERRGELDDDLLPLEPLSALTTIQNELRRPTMAPRLTTWYRRACLSAEEGRIRITLDERLTFCRPQHVDRLGTQIGTEVAPRPEDVIASGPSRILEVKLWGDMPSWLAEGLEGLSPAPHFSKFRMGMMALGQKLGTPVLEPGRTLTPAPTLFALSSTPT